MKMSVGVLDHYNVSTRKLNETVQFYEDVLGFMNGPRPPFNFPGAWLYSAGHPVLHLNDISQTDKQQRPDTGVIDHVAFGSRGFEEGSPMNYISSSTPANLCILACPATADRSGP
jgi:catechol 2,3-dioxygenase-like lactoylglutathione lyase family enzyme